MASAYLHNGRVSAGADLSADALVDAQDRAYVESIDDAELRGTVLSSLVRHRRADRLRVGDPLPQLEVLDPVDGSTVALASLLDGRPLVLVFGSFT
jgi:hypothetical protein